jgi:hypothetical protein
MKHILYLSLLTLIIISNSCKKEYSQEEGSGDKSSGSLVSEITGECLPKTVNGAYIAGTNLGASEYIEVDVDVTKEGNYTISTDTVNGYYFTGSGEFSSTGINTVKLFGKGKPLAEGSDFFIVSYDTTFCEVEVQVLPAGTQPPPPPPATGTYFWKFTVSGTTYQGSVDVDDAFIIDTTIAGFNFKTFYFEAIDSADDNSMSLTLADLGGGISANENYTSPPSGSTNAVHFDWFDAAGNYYETSSTTFTAKVTAHNTSTKVIEGTFSGTAKDMNGVAKAISGGQFKVNYP